jgi:hypothetical protein
MPSAILKKPAPLSVPPDATADWFAWTQHQALALREGRLADLDLETLAEEIETLGRSEQSEIENRLSVLLVHLLKWCYQPSQRSSSWAGTINEQRRKIRRRIAQSPSLLSYPDLVFAEEYRDARRQAAIESGLTLDTFPEEPPFSIGQALQDDFLPER